MWVEKRSNNKFKFVERYQDPYTYLEKRVSTILSSNSTQAHNKARKILSEKIEIELNQTNTKQIPFRIIYEEWYSGHKRTLRDSSSIVYKSIQRIIYDEIDEKVLIDKIDTRFLQKIFNKLDYSSQYISHIKSVLKMVFDYAKDMGIIDTNPIDNIKLIKRAKTLDDYKSIESRYLEIKEADRLINELYRRPSTYRLGNLAEFLYLTGCRIGEAVILKPEDFDFKNKLVKISGTIDYTKGYKTGKKGPTKSIKSNRQIILTDRAIALVERIIDENKLHGLEYDKYVDRGFIFVTKSGTPIQTNSFNISLKAAGERVNLVDKTLSSHIFRHTHVSILAENNVPQKAIMDRVGHSEARVTTQIYTHITSKMKDNITNTLEINGL